jgi:MFS transporter, DHA1 family, 2-module integral membrane pump EmrD
MLDREHQLVNLAYLLVFVGYMTLTLSLPLVGMKHASLPGTTADLRYGLSLLFLMFSVSAISLSRLADIVGARRVLAFAQPVSIIGLLIVAASTHVWIMYLGFFLMGAGTGCYSSIARLIISKHTGSATSMRKAFALFSIWVMVAPLCSMHLMIAFAHMHWRLGYVAMAVIELALLVLVACILKKRAIQKDSMHLAPILKGYGYCLMKLGRSPRVRVWR